MNVLDRLRCELTVLRFDLDMEWRGVPRHRRREYRQEMRSNLHDAVAEQGCSDALARLGGVRELAAAVSEPYRRRPLWSKGALWGVVTFAALTWAYLLCAIAYTEAVRSSGVVGRPVQAESVFPWFAPMQAEALDSGAFTMSLHLPWTLLVLPVVVGLVAARPWRAVGARADVVEAV